MSDVRCSWCRLANAADRYESLMGGSGTVALHEATLAFRGAVAAWRAGAPPDDDSAALGSACPELRYAEILGRLRDFRDRLNRHGLANQVLAASNLDRYASGVGYALRDAADGLDKLIREATP